MKKGQYKKYSQIFEEVIDKGWSKKIIDKLYESNLTAIQFENALRRIKEYFMRNKYWKLVKDLDDQVINEIIGDIQSGIEREVALESKYNEQEKIIWIFNDITSEFKEVKEGDQVEIQIMRSGKWKHPLYGEVNVDDKVIEDVVKNYNEDIRGIDLAIDENHEPNHKALGWIKGLNKKTKDTLFATIELTKIGADLISQGAYKYFSPEIIFNKKDEETGKVINNLLIGGAFTNRPFFKAMQPLMASEEVANGNIDFNKEILFFNNNSGMKIILDLLAKFAEGKFSKEDRDMLTAKFSELPEEDKNEDLTNAVTEATKEAETEEIPKEEIPTKEIPTEEIPKEEVKLEANEGGEVTIQMSELDNLKTLAAQAKTLLDEKRKNEFNEKVKSLVFSENNKVGVVLPKMSNDVAEFAFSLTDDQANKFFEIVSKLQTITIGELGHDQGAEQKYSEAHVKFYTEKMGMSEGEAIEAAIEAAKI